MFLGHARTGEGGGGGGGGEEFLGFGRFMCFLPLSPVLVLWHGTDSLFLCPFVVVFLQYGKRLKRYFH